MNEIERKRKIRRLIHDTLRKYGRLSSQEIRERIDYRYSNTVISANAQQMVNVEKAGIERTHHASNNEHVRWRLVKRAIEYEKDVK